MDEGTTGKITPEIRETQNFPETKIDNMILFYGASISGIKELRRAEETTIGEGLYLTSQLEAAEGYAKRRAKINPESMPTVYQVEVSNLKMADIRGSQALETFAMKLKNRLQEERKKPNLPWYVQNAIVGTLERIDSKSYKSLRELAWNHQEITTEVMRDEGFDGLIAQEGGEGDEIGDHDSYVIFDSTKAKVLKEVSLGIPHI